MDEVTAELATYIDVVIGGQKQVYELATAEALYEALGEALTKAQTE